MHRQVRPFRVAGRQTVDDRGPVVHRPDQARGREVGQADAGGVAVRLLAQAADEDEPHRAADPGSVGAAEGPLAADDVGVHAGAADVLADLVDDEQVGLGETAAGPASRLARTSSSSSRGSKSSGRHRLDAGRLVVGVLDDAQAERDRGACAHVPADRAHHLVVGLFQQDAVIVERAGVLAQADHHHLHQAALDRAVKAGVRLDPGDDADVVGLGGVAVEIDGEALRRSSPS